MKSIRVFYKKKSLLKFVSHLDMNRFMTRMMRKTEIPAWYTEGFNTHLYLAFALPLSLGYESDYEIMDFKITNDGYPMEKIVSELNRVTPEYLEIISAAEPVLKTGDIAFAEFKIVFADKDLSAKLSEFLSKEEIICQKKNKKGEIIYVNIAPKIKSFKINLQDKTELWLVVPAGSRENINPALLIEAFEKNEDRHFDYDITRTGIFDSDMNLFR